uniref:C2H2-type domain-containing protein n=1 Tax=Aegilops tauschii subsp. strangulata TaxID=200361 RepID=A0A453GL28_AEGTS
AAIAAGVDPIAAGGPRPEKLHTCKVCGEVYSSGVRLGGHMRKHYTGKPIVPRKRARLLLPPDVIGLASPGPVPAMEAPVVAPAVQQQLQAPVVPPGCLRLFGVTIMQEAKKEEEPTVDEKQ